ncbi:MAG: MFS transporter [Candidatus Aenigmatarchaeota archaeon]
MAFNKVLWTLSISIFITTLGLGIVSPLLSVYAEEMGASGVWIGLIFSSFAISRLIFLPFIGRFSDTHGRRKFIIAGMVLYAIASFGYVFSNSIQSLITVRFFHGLASAMVFPVAMAYVGDMSKKGHEGRTVGNYNTSFFMGLAFGPVLGGTLSQMFGMHNAFYGMTALSLVALVPILLFLPESRGRRKSNFSFAALFKDRIAKGMMLMQLIRSVGRGMLMAFVPLYAYSLNVTLSEIGLILFIELFFAALLQKAFGRMSDSHKRENLISIGSMFTGATLFLFSFANGFLQLFLLSAAMGIGDAMVMAALTATSISLGRVHGMGSVTGAFNSVMSAGMVIAPLLAGFIMDRAGFAMVFYVGGFISILSVVAFYWVLKN